MSHYNTEKIKFEKSKRYVSLQPIIKKKKLITFKQKFLAFKLLDMYGSIQYNANVINSNNKVAIFQLMLLLYDGMLFLWCCSSYHLITLLTVAALPDSLQ